VADLFDDYMNNTCSVIGRASGVQDAAGLTPRTTTVLEASVPCRVSGVITGDEQKGTKEISLTLRHILMRPWAITGSTPSSPRSKADAAGKTLLNRDMFIQVGSTTYNIKEVINWSEMFHHFTVIAELVE
jgi:hypothetical protein